MKTNYHTHTTRCMHAVGSDEAYVLSAIKGGFQILGFSDHTPWKYGALFTDYATIDLVIVPGVAFDRDGNRLGRGKGYYDRLLPRIPSAYKVGICFPFQIIEEVPAEPFDIRMDEIITQQ